MIRGHSQVLPGKMCLHNLLKMFTDLTSSAPDKASVIPVTCELQNLFHHTYWPEQYRPKPYLLCPQSVPKNPSRQIQMNVSTLTSTHVPPLSQGELTHATHGAVVNGKNVVF